MAGLRPTSLRTRPPQQTLSVASRLTAALGITRLIDATGDDVLGVPVWFAERPAGIVSVLHAGKGVESIDAQVGATMEAIEFAVAEWDAATSPGESWTLGDVVAQFAPPLAIAHFAPILGAPATPERPVLADLCEDVRTGHLYRLPAELVRVPASMPSDGAWLFRWSSNGLASGNSLEEATLHALLEVLERDCVAMDLVDASSQWLDLKSLPAPLAAWAERWTLLGIDLTVRFLPNDFGLACFEACIVQQGAGRPGASYGWGLHPDRQLAVARAITEAAQTRLHALQDTADRDRAAAPRRPAHHVAALDRRVIRLQAVPDLPHDGIEATLRRLLDILKEAGLPWVLRRRMSGRPGGPALDDLCVVKVVVPGCESAMCSELRVGRRLADRLIARSAVVAPTTA